MYPTTTTTASLHYREGNSDKVYQAATQPKDDGFIVTYAYGRHGTTLTTGTKTSVPVPLATATRLFDKLVSAKLAKGYTPSEDGTPYRQTGDEGRDSGIRCQLLNPVEESELARLLTDNRHCLQQKHDGRRMLVRKQGDDITGINRRPTMKILSATITPITRPMPLGMFDPMPEVVATFEDGSTKTLFSFYPDEVSFQASEFAGLTEEEAHDLRQRKDTA
jgi:hypothetical protein